MKNIIKKEEGIYEIDSWVKWPVISIIWWIHWNEVCWISVLDFLKKNLVLSKWKIYLIYGNPDAINWKKRQTKRNLNRMFCLEDNYTEEDKNTYEHKRAQIIKKYLDLSKISLDLHSSPSLDSTSFIICEKNALSIVNNFPIKKVCFWFDNIEPWWTDYYMNSTWKIGICVECWSHNDKKTINKAFFITKTFLNYYGISNFRINKDFSVWGKSFFLAKKSYITKTNKFKIIKKKSDFEYINKWQLIWYDWNNNVYFSVFWRILFARDRKQMWVEWFIEIVEIKVKDNF